jgi:hypothetical protein
MEKEWDEEVVSNEQFRKETDEILERNKRKTIVEAMMGEEYHNYFWDEKHAL